MKSDPLTGNLLLDRLPKESRQRLARQLQPVDLPIRFVLYEARSPIEFTYFPVSCVLSALVVMRSGAMIEVGTVGNEGAAGVPDGDAPLTSPNRVLVQVAGEGLRIGIKAIKKLVSDDASLKQLFSTYNGAFQFQVSQSVACNGLHTVQQRCCRWLLMTHDRIDGDD